MEKVYTALLWNLKAEPEVIVTGQKPPQFIDPTFQAQWLSNAGASLYIYQKVIWE